MAVNQERLQIPAFWRISDWRIGLKLLIAFLTAAIIPVALSGILGYRTSRDAVLVQGITNLLAKDTSTSSAIDQYLDTRREDSLMFGKSRAIANFIGSPTDLPTKLNALWELNAMAARKYYQSVAIVDQRGIILLSTAKEDENTDISSLAYFQVALKGTSYVSDPWISDVTNGPSLFFSAPIVLSSGFVVGAVVSRVSLKGVWDLVETDTNSAGPGTFGLLLDENGVRIAHGAIQANSGAATQTLLYTAVAPLTSAKATQLIKEDRYPQGAGQTIATLPIPEVAAAMANPEIRAFESSADTSSVRHYAAMSTLNVKPWHYVLMTPLPTFTGAADALALQFFLLIIFVAAFTCVVAFFIARGFTGPIVQLTQVADRISMGELNAQIGINRKDEIGQLAIAIGRMQRSLQTMIERIHARRTT